MEWNNSEHILLIGWNASPSFCKADVHYLCDSCKCEQIKTRRFTRVNKLTLQCHEQAQTVIICLLVTMQQGLWIFLKFCQLGKHVPYKTLSTDKTFFHAIEQLEQDFGCYSKQNNNFDLVSILEATRSIIKRRFWLPKGAQQSTRWPFHGYRGERENLHRIYMLWYIVRLTMKNF